MAITNSRQIDDDMQRGYAHAMKNDSVLACKEWQKAWNGIVSAMDSGNISSIEDFDKAFDGMQSVFNWASDYEIELENSVGIDISFAKELISFCFVKSSNPIIDY